MSKPTENHVHLVQIIFAYITACFVASSGVMFAMEIFSIIDGKSLIFPKGTIKGVDVLVFIIPILAIVIGILMLIPFTFFIILVKWYRVRRFRSYGIFGFILGTIVIIPDLMNRWNTSWGEFNLTFVILLVFGFIGMLSAYCFWLIAGQRI